jgi:hypothetical protein
MGYYTPPHLVKALCHPVCCQAATVDNIKHAVRVCTYGLKDITQHYYWSKISCFSIQVHTLHVEGRITFLTKTPL